jgi:protocatechuate 3,4-dioxygenase beta subunit
VIAAFTCLSILASLSLMMSRSSATAGQDPQPQITISGTVVDNRGEPIADVMLSISGSRRAGTLTGPNGAYVISLPLGGSYTVTPTSSGIIFQPSGLSFSNVNANISNANFGGTRTRTFRVSGRIVAPGGAGGDVVIRIGDSPQVLTVSGPTGLYAFDHLTAGATYTLTPSKAGVTFDPPSFTIANLNRDFSGINFVQVRQDQVRISGVVTDKSGQPLADVIVGLSGGEPALITTSAAGVYAFTVPSGGNYVVAPARNGYTFTPPSLAFGNLTRNQSGANFTGASAPTFTISGFVFDRSGSPMVDVLVSMIGSSNGTVPTGPIGNYSFTVLASGSYTIAPLAPGMAFAPPSRSLANLSGDQAGVNFVGAVAAIEPAGINPAGIAENEASPSPSASPTPAPKVRPSPEAKASPSPGETAKDPARKDPAKSTEKESTPVAPPVPPSNTAAAKKAVVPRKRSRVRRSRLRRPVKKAGRKKVTRPKRSPKATTGSKSRGKSGRK